MNTLLQADIFFFIASIATIVLTILCAIVLWHISRVAKNIHAASDAIQNEFSALVEHIANMRNSITNAIESIITKTNKKSSIKSKK